MTYATSTTGPFYYDSMTTTSTTIPQWNNLKKKKFSKRSWKRPLLNDSFFSLSNNIPAACRNCKNHPGNGGDGICWCILGMQSFTSYSI